MPDPPRPDAATPRWRRPALLVARVVVGVATLALVLRHAGLRSVLDALAGADPRLVLAALAFVPPIVLLRLLRWSLLLRGQGVAVPWPLLLRALLVGVLVGQLMPTEVAGDATRAVATRRAGANTSTAVGAVLADRLLGVWALLGSALLGLLAGGAASRVGLPRWSWAVPFALLVLSVVAAAALGRAPLLRSGSGGVPRRFLGAAAETVHAFATRRGTLLAGAVIALLGKLLIAAQVAVLAASLGAAIGPVDMMVLAPVVSAVLAVPVSLGGIGVREAAWALVFARYGFSPAGGVAFAWLLYASMLLEGLAGGLLWIASTRRGRVRGGPSEGTAAAAGELGSAR